MFKIGTLILFLISASNAVAQGCSDAGVCSIGGMNGSGDREEKLSITLNNQYGIGEQNVSILTTQLETVFSIRKKSKVQFKLPWVFANGNLGSTSAAGDITAVFIYNGFLKNDWQMNFNIGFRIATNNSNQTFRIGSPAGNTMSISYPMPYQSSLGTNDLLLGIDAQYKNSWMFAAGFQLPLIQNNRNNFDTALVWNNPEAKAYFSSNRLLRKPDLVVRIDKKFALKKHINLYAGLLPIFHLGDDRITDAGGRRVNLKGSAGITLNLTSAIHFRFTDHFGLTLRYASPLIVRKVRPDGLTRHFVSGLELKYTL